MGNQFQGQFKEITDEPTVTFLSGVVFDRLKISMNIMFLNEISHKMKTFLRNLDVLIIFQVFQPKLDKGVFHSLCITNIMNIGFKKLPRAMILLLTWLRM